MNRRSVLVQGGLALGGLVAAYFTWQRPAELGAGEVVALDVTKTDLEKVRFTDDEAKSWIELTRGKDAGGAFTLVRISGFDASGVALPSGHPGIEVKRPERQVRGNTAAGRLFDRFAPLYASRALGELDAGQLKDFGLDKTKKRVEVTWRGGARRFTVVPAPPGGTDPYFKDEGDGRVYVVSRQILSDFQNAATGLVEKQLHAFFLEDVTGIGVSAGGKRRDFVASRNENAMPGIRIAAAEKPGEADETVRTWHHRIWNLFPSQVLGRDELPPSGAPVVALRIDYSARGRPLGHLELARAGGPATANAAAASVFARSENTVGWVQLPKEAQNLLTEGEALLGRK